MADNEIKILRTAEDVTAEHLTWAERVSDVYFPDEDAKIDWEEFVDQYADPNGYNDAGVPAFDIDEYDNPAIRKIQKHVRAYRRPT